MALFVKEDKTQKSDDGPTAPSMPTATALAARDVQAHLGHGSRVEGKLAFDGSVRIDGHVDGEISAQDTVIIGEGAEVTAQITANTVIIQGRITGDVTARKRVELKAPAVVSGNISTPSIVIHEGVVFEGHCTMGGAATRSERGDKRIALVSAEERSGAARRTSDAAG